MRLPRGQLVAFVARPLLEFLSSPVTRGLRALGYELRSTAPSISSMSNPSESLLATFGFPTKSGASVTFDTAPTISAVYGCMQILSGLLARLPLRLIQKTAKGTEVITDHVVWPLINVSPDGIRNPFAWRQLMEAQILTRGNAYSRIRRNQFFEPVALEWMNPIHVECWRTEDGEVFYRYKGKVLYSYEVFHHREMSMDGIIGLSPVTAMREAMGVALVTQEHASRYFSNGAAPSVVFTAPLGATKDQMDRIRDEILKNHGGVANSGKPMVAYGGLTISPISLTNEDSQFLESRKFDVEEIARAYRVPLHLLQSTEKTTSWGSGVEQLNRAFVDYSLADRMRRWESELDMALLTDKERSKGLGFKFDTSEMTRGTVIERAQYYQAMRNIGAFSVNDVREMEGFNDLPDNIGDNYLLKFNGTGGTSPADQNSEQGGKKQPVTPDGNEENQ
jgi:HK97 family phage portal protein